MNALVQIYRSIDSIVRGVRWLVCNVRKGTRWLYRGYTWQRLVQSSVQSFEGAPCRAPPKALPEALLEALHEALPEALQKALLEPLHKALPEALYEPPSKLYTELHQSSAWSSLKALHGAPLKLYAVYGNLRQTHRLLVHAPTLYM